MPIKTLLGLILGNLVWSAHPVMGKLMLADFTATEASWLRYASALLFFILGVAVLRKVRPDLDLPYVFKPASRSDWFYGIFLGFMAFCFAPLLTMAGLVSSQATDGALIVAMEPLITVFLAWMFLRERMSPLAILTFAVALTGFAFLADLTPAKMSGQWDPHMWGNLLILVSLVGEAAYSTLARKLIDRHSPVGILGFALISGVVFLTIAAVLKSGQPGASPYAGIPIDFLSRAGWKSLVALLWLGPFGTTASYLFWMIALRKASVASVALTLFVQPVCGAIWGYLFLGDRLSAAQFAGGATILLAVFAQTLIQLQREPANPRDGLEVEK